MVTVNKLGKTEATVVYIGCVRYYSRLWPWRYVSLLRHFWLFAPTVLSCFLFFRGVSVITVKGSQATVRWVGLLWKYSRYSVLSLGAFGSFCLCLTGPGPWLLFTSSFAFSVFQAVFWSECLQCCGPYCSTVNVCLCWEFLCYSWAVWNCAIRVSM